MIHYLTTLCVSSLQIYAIKEEWAMLIIIISCYYAYNVTCRSPNIAILLVSVRISIFPFFKRVNLATNLHRFVQGNKGISRIICDFFVRSKKMTTGLWCPARLRYAQKGGLGYGIKFWMKLIILIMCSTCCSIVWHVFSIRLYLTHHELFSMVFDAALWSCDSLEYVKIQERSAKFRSE